VILRFGQMLTRFYTATTKECVRIWHAHCCFLAFLSQLPLQGLHMGAGQTPCQSFWKKLLGMIQAGTAVTCTLLKDKQQICMHLQMWQAAGDPARSCFMQAS
jgi:hypothetical protein